MASYVDEIDAEESAIDQELGLLQAIYVNELEVQNGDSDEPVTLSVTLHPSTADNADLQYVCLTLIITLSPQYPDEIPDIAIKNPRGISDEQINSITTQLHQLASEQKGSAMLYELIEVAKEALTHNNTPYGQCVICMDDFKEGEAFTKTACYHHFHCDCLARYIQHALEDQKEKEEKAKQNGGTTKVGDKQEVVCAVCREPITYDLKQLCSTPKRTSPKVQYKPDHDMQQLQKKMAALYLKQKEKGGIIDIEAESNKFLIDISVTPTLPMSSVISSATSDEKDRNTGSDQRTPADAEKTSDKLKDRRSQLRYNNSNRHSSDGEKQAGSSNSYNKSYGERRGGRGRGSSRPTSSTGRQGDRQYYKSDRSRWRDDDRRPNRSREKESPRDRATEARDGDKTSKESVRKSQQQTNDGNVETASLKENKVAEEATTKNNNSKVGKTEEQVEGKGKDDGVRSEGSSSNRVDRRPRDRVEDGSNNRPSSSSGRPDRRENRKERYYDRNDRPRFSHVRENQGRNRDSDKGRSGPKPTQRDDTPSTSKDDKAIRNPHQEGRKHNQSPHRNHKDRRHEQSPSRKQEDRRHDGSPHQKQEDYRHDRNPRRNRDGRKQQEKDRYRGNGSHQDRPRNDIPSSEHGRRRDNDHFTEETRSSSGRPQSQGKKSSMRSDSEKSRSEESRLESKTTERLERTNDGPRSGNSRQNQPNRRNDTQRNRDRYDRERSNQINERRIVEKSISSKQDQGIRKMSSKLDEGGESKFQGDRAQSDVRISDEVARKSKPPPGFEPVANEVKPKVKPPPGFEEFR